MNSKQRRKYKREFPHEIISIKFKHELASAEIVKWCNNQFGEKNYRLKWAFFRNPSVIGFLTEEHKTLFLLRWSDRV